MSASVERRLLQYQDDFRRTQTVFSELWTLYPGGRARTVRVLFSGFLLSDGRTGMLCEARDEVDLEPERLRSADALLHTQLMISLYSTSGKPLYRNPAARASIGQHGDDLRLRFAEPAAYEDFIGALTRAGEVSRVLRIKTQQGARWHEVTARQCRDAVTGEAAILVSEVDVSDLKNTQAKAQYLAYHDPLTSLPNRASVPKHFDARIAAAAHAGESIGVLFLDLDDFKVINDSLGHSVGDDVLRTVAQRLLDLERPEMATIRLGGDEFLMIVSGCDRETYEGIALAAIAKMSEPVIVGHHRLNVTASIGISRYPEDGTDGATLMKSADLAMYEAKEAGRNCFHNFSIRLARTGGPAPGPAIRHKNRPDRREFRGLLPATGLAEGRPHRRRRGPGTLEPSRAGDDLPCGVYSDLRGDGTDRGIGSFHHADRHEGAAAAAGSRLSFEHLDQRVAAPVELRRIHGRGGGGACIERLFARLHRIRDH